MSLRAATVMINTPDAQTLSQWWLSAFGGEVVADLGAYVITRLDGVPVNVGFQTTDGPGKGGVHLDFAADDRAAEVSRLVAAGAAEVGEHSIGDFRWTVLQDPEGNELCVSG